VSSWIDPICKLAKHLICVNRLTISVGHLHHAVHGMHVVSFLGKQSMSVRTKHRQRKAYANDRRESAVKWKAWLGGTGSPDHGYSYLVDVVIYERQAVMLLKLD